ncbi:MAG TPA: ATP-binding cassette domain-containing protein [Candidatus Limnocylindrales bacterium]|nr:ATP-binding cassette domain-containing protein [Candidatus Limnocylindrales bacterium]
MAEPLLRVRDAHKRFDGREVLRGISFDLECGAVAALVGVSGSGKSTVARCIAGFDRLDSGEILLNGSSIAGRVTPAIQLILQQPAAALNPRFTAEEIVAEPLVIQKRGTARWRRERSHEMMRRAGLNPADSRKRALEFSGGERQRLAIARALAAEPKLLILDESFSGLDSGVLSRTLALIDESRREHGTGCLIISHYLATVLQWAAEVLVLDGGEIVERGPAAQIAADGRHPRTRELWEASASLALPL